MSTKRCCSLCRTASSEYKFLQNEMGESNQIYEIAVKYFDPMLLADEEYIKCEHIQLLCESCWFHINDFHEFQQTVLKTRMLWVDEKQVESLNIQIKEEDISNISQQSENLDRNEDEFFEDNCVEKQNFKTEFLSSSFDDVEINTSNETEQLVSKQIENNTEIVNKHNKLELSEGKKPKGISSLNQQKARESDKFIAEWKPELVCDLCNEITNNFDELRAHFKATHNTRFYIKCCDRKFFRRCILVNHIQLHLNPETHKCDICGKSSSTKHNLKLHKKIMHEDTKQLKCDICGRLFKQKVTLERHLLTHATRSKDFICSECGKGYVTEPLLKLHIKHVHNVDRVCDQCGKTIHGIQALKKHLMEHAGIERPKFPCDMCGLELKSPCGLKRHIASYHNDGTTVYVCGICGKVAASENALWTHKKSVHVQERKHKCTYCEKAFKRPKSLREHIATHTGQSMYKCPHCPKVFKSSSNWSHHRKHVHPVEWEELRKNRIQHPKINQEKKQIVIG